jgi:hypothetical protein
VTYHVLNLEEDRRVPATSRSIRDDFEFDSFALISNFQVELMPPKHGVYWSILKHRMNPPIDVPSVVLVYSIPRTQNQ